MFLVMNLLSYKKINNISFNFRYFFKTWNVFFTAYNKEEVTQMMILKLQFFENHNIKQK